MCYLHQRRHCPTLSVASSGELYLFAKRPFMSDTVSVKMKKTKKIDVRLDQALFDLVDNHAQASRLSRGQVVERALLQLFGQPVADDPIPQGNDKTPEHAGAKILKMSKNLDSLSSIATKKNSHLGG